MVSPPNLPALGAVINYLRRWREFPPNFQFLIDVRFELRSPKSSDGVVHVLPIQVGAAGPSEIPKSASQALPVL